MKHYIDITLLPSDDIGVHFLWSKVMMQVHLALVEIKDEHEKVPVAVSFPDYREKKGTKSTFIGEKLRLLAADKADLERLNIPKWLNRLSDYVHIRSIANVPSTNVYEAFTRHNAAESLDKLIRRRMRRHNESVEQAKKYFEGYLEKSIEPPFPFIRMKSLESQHAFCLVIIRRRVDDRLNSEQQAFNTYGLSAKGVLPKF